MISILSGCVPSPEVSEVTCWITRCSAVTQSPPVLLQLYISSTRVRVNVCANVTLCTSDRFPLFYFKGFNFTVLRRRRSLCCVFTVIYMEDQHTVSTRDDDTLLPNNPVAAFHRIIWTMPTPTPPNGCPPKPWGWIGRGAALISRSPVINLPVHSIHKEGSSFTCASSRYRPPLPRWEQFH